MKQAFFNRKRDCRASPKAGNAEKPRDRRPILRVEDLIDETDLPANARQSIQEKFPNATVTFAEKITQGDRISYRATANKDDKLFTVQIDADRKLTSTHEVKVTNVFTRAPE